MNKYTWHDIRKNPQDLPKNNIPVLALLEEYDGDTFFYDVIFFDAGDNAWIAYDQDYVTYNQKEDALKVMAWKPIEPFEEE